MLKLLILLLALAACSKAKDSPEPEIPQQGIRDRFDEASDRLLSEFVWMGYVVSREPGGAAAHTGDALIWTGLAMHAMDCDKGAQLEEPMVDMIDRMNGALVRFEPLGEYEGGREISLDGALGLYRGIASRITRCPESIPIWKEAVAQHVAFFEKSGGKLHPNVSGSLIGGFVYVLDLLAYRLGGTRDPSPDLLRRLEAQIAIWAGAVNAGHQACFRINLGLLALQTVETLGTPISAEGRNAFCAATKGTDIPTVEQWCGRGGLTAWIDGFQQDLWEYRHQRCGAWENPDGDGLRTPGLDLLVGIRDAYHI